MIVRNALKIAFHQFNFKEFLEVCQWPLTNWTVYLVFAINLKFWSTKLKVDCLSDTIPAEHPVRRYMSLRKMCLHRQYNVTYHNYTDILPCGSKVRYARRKMRRNTGHYLCNTQHTKYLSSQIFNEACSNR